mmetsp:Transcript_9955/g.27090  ORF Transcript_9955/g.27090 Transcript_9955/m.27090 type:complete len:192 (+) Transcript_9955:49-624(+)|eukprot:CAMPEP_0202345978 /NCGR_PEP_ID=MMETSP1126-20121109/4971_1 /ASSEMBLY_ACC=CAM_ASM_000457 /TAXON_ID=3047 /ORGANISM="Dunaliella tertiolecta, Strain CCMP1320" /LENGTH=191 /DNA_ID=CAMNT_0048937331 /DNA_START=57 /DNA_END=632 /DNA_ORIENTATION=+
MQSTMLKGSHSLKASTAPKPQSRRQVVSVEANKRVQKKAKVIYKQSGEIKTVPLGYWRNFLKPSLQAEIASESVLASIRKAKEDEIRAKLEVKAQAQSFANALSTIGKFVIRKKVGERDQIYGSVQKSEVADAIYQQTGRNLADAEITVPEIKAVGTYECQVKLHPEVTASFNVVIQREKNITVKTSGKKK